MMFEVEKMENEEIMAPDYVQELVELIRSGESEETIAEQIDNYHDNDICLRDMFGNLYKVVNRDGLMYIYNYKKRDNYKEELYDIGVNSLRINMDR